MSLSPCLHPGCNRPAEHPMYVYCTQHSPATAAPRSTETNEHPNPLVTALTPHPILIDGDQGLSEDDDLADWSPTPSHRAIKTRTTDGTTRTRYAAVVRYPGAVLQVPLARYSTPEQAREHAAIYIAYLQRLAHPEHPEPPGPTLNV